MSDKKLLNTKLKVIVFIFLLIFPLIDTNLDIGDERRRSALEFCDKRIGEFIEKELELFAKEVNNFDFTKIEIYSDEKLEKRIVITETEQGLRTLMNSLQKKMYIKKTQDDSVKIVGPYFKKFYGISYVEKYFYKISNIVENLNRISIAEEYLQPVSSGLYGILAGGYQVKVDVKMKDIKVDVISDVKSYGIYSEFKIIR